jgi:PHD/YefM family antitoxin component YafN of YafNO toxin-antitoxin module
MAKMANRLKEPAMRVTATEAKNRFGSLCAQAKHEPVFVEKAGQLDTVILSAQHYQALQAGQGRASLAARKKAFEAEFGDWIAAQNARVESHGIPGADLRPW